MVAKIIPLEKKRETKFSEMDRTFNGAEPESEGCRWPDWPDGETPTFKYCNKPTERGKSFCKDCETKTRPRAPKEKPKKGLPPANKAFTNL